MTKYDWKCSGCGVYNTPARLNCECGKHRWQQIDVKLSEAWELQAKIVPQYVIYAQFRGIAGVQ